MTSITDYQSPHRDAQAGDNIFASVTYNATANAYDMLTQNLSNGDMSKTTIPVVEDVVYTNAFFVVEHQVARCSQMPSSGSLTFTNVTLVVENAPVTPQWESVVGNTVCILSRVGYGPAWRSLPVPCSLRLSVSNQKTVEW